MLLTVATLLVTVGLSHGYICCMSRKFDAVEYFQQATVVEGVPHVAEGSAIVSLDSDTQMTNAYVTTITDGKTTSVRVIEDYKGRTRYTVTSDGSQCDKTEITTNWTDPCIPDGSQKTPPLYYGMSPSQFDIDIYTVPYQQVADLKAFVTVSRADCTIISEAMKGSMGGVPFMASVGIFNATAGIRDPSVFKIPPSCSSTQKAQKVEAPFRLRSVIMP